MKRDLVVEIPKKFKRSLSKRFSSKFLSKRSYGGYYNIKSIKCPICISYKDCEECLFSGDYCSKWLRETLSKYLSDRIIFDNCIVIRAKNRTEALKIIKEFRKEVVKHIKWI